MTTNTSHDPTLDKARAALARTDLGRLDYLRALQEAVRNGMGQRDIARTLGITQSAISQALANAAARGIRAIPPGFSGASPWEIATRYAAGDIDRSEMIRQLSTWPYVKKQDSAKQLSTEWKAILPPEEPGTFDEVGEAFDRGLIDAEAYDTILEASDEVHDSPTTL